MSMLTHLTKSFQLKKAVRWIAVKAPYIADAVLVLSQPVDCQRRLGTKMQRVENGEAAPEMMPEKYPNNGVRGPTVHYINFSHGIYQLLLQKAPHINVKFVKTAVPFSVAPELCDLGNPEDIEVVFASSNVLAMLIEAGVKFPKLKWFHTITAGTDILIRALENNKVAPHFVITRSTISTDTVSEYVVGQIIAHQRQFYQYHDQQKEATWFRVVELNQRCLGLSNYSVLILGVGQIGKRMAKLLNTIGMTVYGVTRSPVETGHGSPDVHHYRTTEELSDTLSQVDFIVNVLPSTAATRGLLDNDALRVCQQKKPVFINVGRGDIITEDSVIKALRSGWISDAVLDVFPVEPLPPDSLLWKEPGVTLTPHVAMDMMPDAQEKGLAQFLENYDRFVNRQEMVSVVDFNTGY